MSFTWRMHVRNQAGVSKGFIDPANHLVSIQSLSVDPRGDCLQGTFTAVPARIDVRPRDLVQVQISEDDGETWLPIFLGVVKTAGNPRSYARQDYEMVGLRELYYERIMRLPWVPQDDVADMALGVLQRHPITGVTIPSSLPTLGFVAGDRFAPLQTVGEFLDDLKATVGSFVVPPGSTYVYNFWTYNPGDVVPATGWGVRATGEVFFARPDAFEEFMEVAEDDRNVGVVWREISAEGAKDAVWIVLGSAFDLEHVVSADYRDDTGLHTLTANLFARPVAYYDGDISKPLMTGADLSFADDWQAVHVVENPLDFMEKVPMGVTVIAGDYDDTEGNAIDGSLATSTTASTPGGGGSLRFRPPTPVGLGIWRLRYSLNESVSGRADLSVRIVGPGTHFSRVSYRLEDAGAGVRDLYLLSTPVAQYASTPTWTELNVSERGMTIYEAELYVADAEAIDLLAQSLIRPPPPEVAEIVVKGFIRAGTQAYLTPSKSLDVEKLDVGRVEYSITTESGFLTRIHTGIPFDAPLYNERIILERLAKRVTS